MSSSVPLIQKTKFDAKSEWLDYFRGAGECQAKNGRLMAACVKRRKVMEILPLFCVLLGRDRVGAEFSNQFD
jgi:hypothetical protein